MTADLLLRINGMTDARKLRADQNLKIITGPFSAVVNKSAYTVDLYIGPPGESGSMFVKEYRCALGKDDSFRIFREFDFRQDLERVTERARG